MKPLAELPDQIRDGVSSFVEKTRSVLGPDLKSIALYGSAAEGQLRSTSDVNLLILLSGFDPDRIEHLREPLRTAQLAIRLKAMFIMESELPDAVEAFAVKFADIVRRHKMLYGDDPFETLRPSRTAEITRLKQTLLNLTLRMREAYISRGLREEQLAAVIAESASGLRASAAALLELEGAAVPSPRQALEKINSDLGSSSEVLAKVSEARREGLLAAGTAAPTLLGLIELARAMLHRANKLS